MKYLQTFNSRSIDFFEPSPLSIDPRDIIHSLSHTCRFGGHSRYFYSVAQHSLMCYEVARDLGYDLNTQKWALLHDASEAYLGDMPKPFKVNMPDFIEAEERFSEVVIERFGLSHEMPDLVKVIDNRVLITERNALFKEVMIVWEPWSHIKPYDLTIRWQPIWWVKRRFTRVMRKLGWEVVGY